MSHPEPRRSPWLTAFFHRHTRRRLRRGFDGVHMEGLERLTEAASAGPLVVASNHVAWWDGFLYLALEQAGGLESFALMDAENLARLRFFRGLGAIPLDRAAPLHGLRQGVRVLDRPGRALWVFPQGRQRPAHLRPLGLWPGVSTVARQSGAPIVPVSLNYLFRESSRPAALVSVGEPLAPDAPLAHLEAALVAGLDRIDRFVDEGSGAFGAWLAGPKGRAEDGPGSRALRLLQGAS